LAILGKGAPELGGGDSSIEERVFEVDAVEWGWISKAT
jgi:hypothetical protein